MTWAVAIEAEPSDSTRDAISVALRAHNAAAVGDGAFTPLAITVRDDAGTIAGGLWGYIWHHFLFIEMLAMGEARGGGVGREVMALAEAEALRRGCTGIWLDTFDWQAPWFYPKFGFEEFGRIADYIPGQDRIFLMKRLGPADG